MKYPIGIQNFEKLRRDNYVYIDKTELMYRLVSTGCYYFLSRPRRFGKSLLISTLDAYFRGKKDVFHGLAVEKLENEWTEHPVLRLDLNSGSYANKEGLLEILNIHLREWEKIYGANAAEESIGTRFRGIVQRAYEKTGQRVAILVDEYDKPLVQNIDNEERQEEMRNVLKTFYSVLKTQDQYIRFAMLTGVSKFSKMSVFSDLNNLADISMDKRFADICGITEDELRRYFSEPVQEMADKFGISNEEMLARLRRKYDGYHFSKTSVGVYNTFSILNALRRQDLENYWFETGTPTFLIKKLQSSDYELNNLAKEEQAAEELGSIDVVNNNPIPLLYQTGYLTIKGYDEDFQLYHLSFPNEEVENAFTKHLVPAYSPIGTESSPFFIKNFVQEVRRGDVEGFLTRLQTLYEDNSYQVQGKKELYFQNTMYVVFKLLGLYVDVEKTTARGRIDMVITTADYVYVVEIKLDGTPDEALQQIEEKGYAAPFAHDKRKLYKIGINFSSATRGIEGWKVE